MKIIVFGTERCKFCKIQQKYLENHFNSDEWMYVDVVKDMENLKIASSVNIDKLPTVVLLNEKNKEIYRKEGTLSPDKIFQILEGNSKLPIFEDDIKGEVILSYDPKFVIEETIKAYSINGKYLYDVKIKSCKRIRTRNINADKKDRYMKRGGRKDFCWIVNFTLVGGKKE